MSRFLLLIIVAWVGGVVIGLVGGESWWLIGLVVGAILLANKKLLGWIRLVGLFLLIALGGVYGWSVGHQEVAGCGRTDDKMAKVVSRPEYMARQVRFVAQIQQCKMLVSVSPWTEIMLHDDILLVGGRRQSLKEVRDYSAGYADYLERRNIGGTWFMPAVEIIKENSFGGWFPGFQTQKLSDALQYRIKKLFVEPDGSLVQGMLLAQKGTIPEGITEQFRMTGVSHILAISGLHVSIMAGFIYLLVSWLPFAGWWRTGLVVLMVWMYILFIDAPVSAVRAGSFITVAMVFIRLSRLVSLPTALAGTVGVSVTISPAVMLEVGWQLSIGAVTGIFLMLFVTKQTQPRLAKGGVARWLYNSVIVSAGAFLATWPLMVYHFGNLSLISLLANVLAIPIVPFVLMSALGSLIISGVWMGGAVMVGALTHVFISWLVFITGILSRWPGVYIEELSIPVWFIVLYFVGLLGVAHLVLVCQKRSWREVWA